MGENQPAVDGLRQWEAISKLVASSQHAKHVADLLMSALQKADAFAEWGGGNHTADTFGVEAVQTWTCSSCGSYVSHNDVYLHVPGPCELNSVQGYLRFQAPELLASADWESINHNPRVCVQTITVN